MKKDFDNMAKQMTYINKFLTRRTNLEKKCQKCGKPGKIQHNRANPYRIRILCLDCKKELGMSGETVDSFISDFPIIDLTEHINTESRVIKYIDLSKYYYEVDEAIKDKISRKDFCKKYHRTYYFLNKLLETYDKEKPGIKKEFEEMTYKKRRDFLLDKALDRSKAIETSNNKIIEAKRSLGYSNKELLEKLQSPIPKITLNLIIEGKVQPTEEQKQSIAKALNKKVEDLF